MGRLYPGDGLRSCGLRRRLMKGGVEMGIRSLRALVVEAAAVSAIMWLLVHEFERRGGIWFAQDVASGWQWFMRVLGG